MSGAVLAVLLYPNAGITAEPIDHAATLAPFLNDDTFAVVYLHVAALPQPGNPAEIFQLLPKLPEEAQQQLLGLTMASGFVDKFQSAGGQGIYLVAGLRDLHDAGGPVLIAAAADNQHPAAVEQMSRDLIQGPHDDQNQVSLHSLSKILEVRRRGDVVLVGTKDSVNRYSSLAASERKDITEPLTRLSGEGAVFAGAFAPGPDFRRVVRELWPALPPPMTPLKGELADRWRTLEFAANLPPNVNPRIILQTTDPESAQTFVDLYRALPAAIDQITELGDDRAEAKRYAEMITGLIPPQIDGPRVTLRLSTAPPQMENLRALFSGLTDKALESSRRNKRMNQFKELAIAMLNYADVNKHLPPAAICDKEGRPLLSWRGSLAVHGSGGGRALQAIPSRRTLGQPTQPHAHRKNAGRICRPRSKNPPSSRRRQDDLSSAGRTGHDLLQQRGHKLSRGRRRHRLYDHARRGRAAEGGRLDQARRLGSRYPTPAPRPRTYRSRQVHGRLRRWIGSTHSDRLRRGEIAGTLDPRRRRGGRTTLIC